MRYFLTEGFDARLYLNLESVGWDVEPDFLDIETLFDEEGNVLRLTRDKMRLHGTSEVVRKDPQALADALLGCLTSPRRSLFRTKPPLADRTAIQNSTLPELVDMFQSLVKPRK